jgi:hypothetical protein
MMQLDLQQPQMQRLALWRQVTGRLIGINGFRIILCLHRLMPAPGLQGDASRHGEAGFAQRPPGVGGAFLSLSYPGSWNEGLSSGQGLMAVALVIFARWDPVRAILAALFFGAAGAIGPSLQAVGITQGYYFFNAAPYILTLFIMIASAQSKSAASDAPGELSIVK